MIWMLGAAWAGADLLLEQSRAALDEHRFGDAIQLSLEAVQDHPEVLEGYRLYLDASSAAGMQLGALHDLRAAGVDRPEARLLWLFAGARSGDPGDLADLEAESGPHRDLLVAELRLDTPTDALSLLSGVEGESARWLELRAWMRVDEAQAARRARAISARYPESPHLLSPLFEETSTSTKLQRTRKALVAKVARHMTTDPVLLYRQRALFLAAGRTDLAARAAERLEKAGEHPPLDRPALDRVGRTRLARKLVDEGQLTPAPGPVGDHLDLLAKMSEALRVDGRLEDAVTLWEQARATTEHPTTASLHAEALTAVGRYDEAVDVADRALVLAVQPVYDDLAWTDLPARRKSVAMALEARSRALEARAEVGAALVDLTLSLLFDPDSSREFERRSRLITSNATARLDEKYADPRTAAHLIAIERAERAIAERAPEKALVMASDALAIIAAKGRRAPASYAPELAEAASVRARAWLVLGDPERALVDFALAHLLRPAGLDPEATRLRGEMLEGYGHLEAAFSAYVLAAATGADVSDDALSRTSVGLSSWQARAAGVVATFAREIGLDDDTAMSVRLASVLRTSPAGRTGGPVLGEEAPAWQVSSQDGGLSDRGARGQVVLLVFWASWCTPCHTELPALADLARRLQDEGAPVEVVAISIDDQTMAYEKAKREIDMGGLVVTRDPDLAETFAVSSVPTVFVIDPAGVAKHRFVGYSGSIAPLEQEIGLLLP